jgi:hypothetical protein
MPAITQEGGAAAVAGAPSRGASSAYTNLARLATQLSVPQLFAGEQPSASSSSSSQEGAHLRAAERWTRDILPRLLEEVRRELDLLAANVTTEETSGGAKEDNAEEERILASVIKALAKYVPPARIDIPDDDNASLREEAEVVRARAQGKGREGKQRAIIAGKDWIDPFIGSESNRDRALGELDPH